MILVRHPAYWLYRGVTSLIEPGVDRFLARRVRRGKEDAARCNERKGVPGYARPTGRLIWLHGASVGESLAVLPLIERLTERGFAVLVTTGTVSSAAILAHRLPPAAIHQFVPLDVPRFLRGFLDHWRPDLVILAESELWPNLIAEVGRRGPPLVVVNARMSPRSFRTWRRLPSFARAMLAGITLCLAQSDDDATRLIELGAARVTTAGNLKFDGSPPPADAATVEDLAGRIGSRPVWVAASTHAEEEAIVLGAHRRLLPRYPDLLTIVVPRQTERGGSIVERTGAEGLRADLRSAGQPPGPDTQVYVADTMGELGLFYRLVTAVFIGKSLAGGGGQNPIEAAKLGCAILHGPLIGNFQDVYRLLDEDHGAAMVADGEALARMLDQLFADAAELRRMGQAASDAVARGGGATDRIMEAIDPILRGVFATDAG